MEKTLKEIADLLGVELVGDPQTVISGIASIQEAQEGQITFIGNPKFSRFAKETKASAIISSLEIKDFKGPILKTKYPSFAFNRLIEVFYPTRTVLQEGIHSTAIIGKNVKIGLGVSLGPYVVIGDDSVVGNNSRVYSGVSIGHAVTIGESCIIHANVSIRENTHLSNRVIVQNGAVIGSDGFGYDTVDGIHHKIPHVGSVFIEDDVEIGANVTIDRARFDMTLIGRGTKIDNLVQIAHNVTTGEGCIIVSQVGVSGSTKIGNGAILAGQAGIAGHLKIGDKAIIGAQAGVVRSIAPETFVSGYPARPHKHATKINALVQRLPRLYDEVSKIKEWIKGLDSKK